MEGEGPWGLPDGSDDCEIVFTPGHTEAHCVLYYKPQKVESSWYQRSHLRVRYGACACSCYTCCLSRIVLLLTAVSCKALRPARRGVLYPIIPSPQPKDFTFEPCFIPVVAPTSQGSLISSAANFSPIFRVSQFGSLWTGSLLCGSPCGRLRGRVEL